MNKNQKEAILMLNSLKSLLTSMNETYWHAKIVELIFIVESGDSQSASDYYRGLFFGGGRGLGEFYFTQFENSEVRKKNIELENLKSVIWNLIVV
jgi:hypothetical protein